MPIIRFDQLRNHKHIVSVWGIAPEDLDIIAATADQSTHYQMMRIPKSGNKNRGKYRTVFRPAWGVLHQVQKNLARDIGDSVPFPECVQGFVARRSAVSNARIHVGARVVLHADIKDFFDAITIEQVTQAFIRLGCDLTIAQMLAKICTLNGRLPQGASTSPVVANLVCLGLDTDLTRLASQIQARYSRYADDLTWSGDTVPDIATIRQIVETYGFALREDKVRTQWRGKSQYVTGLSIADPSGPRVPKRMKRQLRLQLYYATKYSVAGHQERTGNDWHPMQLRQHWRGWIDYINSVPADRTVAERLRRQLDAL